jgi:hypothetical protein
MTNGVGEGAGVGYGIECLLRVCKSPRRMREMSFNWDIIMGLSVHLQLVEAINGVILESLNYSHSLSKTSSVGQ